MLKYVLYPLFGAGVLGAYAVSSVAAVDVSSVSTHRTRMPAHLASQPAAYGTAPVIWRTGFHGPAAAQRRSSTRSGGGGFFIGTGGGGYSGGFGGK